MGICLIAEGVQSMLRLLSGFLFSLLLCHAAASQSEVTFKQEEMAGAKLGVKASSLGIKLDSRHASYAFKNKFYLSGFFEQEGHPIFKITQYCNLGSAKDHLLGIKCNDDAQMIVAQFGSNVEPLCSNEGRYWWDGRFEAEYYYNKKTNHFWIISPSTKKVTGFGISLPNVDMVPCIRRFPDDQISKVKLGINAKDFLGSNLPIGNEGFLSESVKVVFAPTELNSPITEIHFRCDKSGIETAVNRTELVILSKREFSLYAEINPSGMANTRATICA
jgi:hypothetical protein